jgi:hypothetical protein
MNDVDKILEAEQTILALAEELKKMKNATQLLDSSQEKVQELIRSSEQVITLAGNFTKVSGEVINRLNEMDIDTRLGELKEIGSDTKSKIEEYSASVISLKNEILKALEQNSEIIGKRFQEENTKMAMGLQQILKIQKFLFILGIIDGFFLIALLLLLLLR